MNQKVLIFLGAALILLAGIAIGYFAHEPETITNTEYLEYTKFTILENVNITAIEQQQITTTIYFDTTTATDLTQIFVNGKHFTTAQDWNQTYTFLIAQRPDSQWQLIYYEAIQ